MAKQQIKQQDRSASVSASAGKQSIPSIPFIFDRSNYLLMIVGVLVIFIGFGLMSGGATTDPNVFPESELYSFRRITLAPIVVMIGFGIEIFAILKRPKK
ncbi:MAG: DUF3098 domain-containing protein [Bacteroidetes bacterium]|nr:DUF3098 domain-containing protein [Bacteroidota bacterium]MBK8658167.1 DUF3098 domain-containing protein [Bacteroidota bacterium]